MQCYAVVDTPAYPPSLTYILSFNIMSRLSRPYSHFLTVGGFGPNLTVSPAPDLSRGANNVQLSLNGKFCHILKTFFLVICFVDQTVVARQFRQTVGLTRRESDIRLSGSAHSTAAALCTTRHQLDVNIPADSGRIQDQLGPNHLPRLSGSPCFARNILHMLVRVKLYFW